MKVVVGVCGSPACEGAVRAGWDAAVAHGAALEILTVWEHPVMADYAGLAELPHMDEELERAAQEMAAEMLRAVAGERGSPAPQTSVRAVCGAPGQVLAAAVTAADRIYVGGPRPGLLHRLLPGSVAGYLLHHAPCPVTVVPYPVLPATTEHADHHHHGAPAAGPTSEEIEMMARLVR